MQEGHKCVFSLLQIQFYVLLTVSEMKREQTALTKSKFQLENLRRSGT